MRLLMKLCDSKGAYIQTYRLHVNHVEQAAAKGENILKKWNSAMSAWNEANPLDQRALADGWCIWDDAGNLILCR